MSTTRKSSPVMMPCPMPRSSEGLRQLLKTCLEKALAIAPEHATGFSLLVAIEGAPDTEGPVVRGYTLHGGEVHASNMVRMLVGSLTCNGAESALLHDAIAMRDTIPTATAPGNERSH
ncbi:hypothetical protein DA2_3778 [Desulfovibrio sp. A2]|nr:hypothetical protein DA2_3778 [Desulfovibrio sp. A2]